MGNKHGVGLVQKTFDDVLSEPFVRQAPPTRTVQAAVHVMSSACDEDRGAIFTLKSVVDFILDLVGYVAEKPLHQLRLLEPSFGGGDFLLAAIDRLVTSCQKTGFPFAELSECIRAVELHRSTFLSTRKKVLELLVEKGISPKVAEELASAWLICNDFLLTDLEPEFDFVIGNPPYVRQERIPEVLLAEYRKRYSTLYDRADLYIPFIERSLSLLKSEGHLGFICADRWMKNRYGGPLREMIAKGFHLKIFVDMFHTEAFQSAVTAYPAITVIAKQRAGATRIAHKPNIAESSLKALASELISSKPPKNDSVRVIHAVTDGAEPWLLESSDQLDVLRRLEAEFPLLEEAGCKVGIGVATGADHAFIAPFDSLDVEPSRKLPLAMTGDLLNGEVDWQGYGIINPFAENGGLVDLEQYPRLQKYLAIHKERLVARHCAKMTPNKWYRTIDRIYPELALRPKLLIPDIKGEAHVVYESGRLYPHHNLYHITSDEWDLKALQAVLLSGIARLFVSTYTTKMRGGYLRFQAQYLRRIRLPKWTDIPKSVRTKLIAAAERGDVDKCNQAVFDLYALTSTEREALGGNGK